MSRLAAEYFHRMYAQAADPWGFTDRWYERRKRAVTLAALPAERYRRGYEPGCSIGELTAGLADRCEQLLATDVSPRAVALARRRLAGAGHVRIAVADVAEPWPAGPFDLVVLSELGYYFSGAELDRLVDAATGALAVDGTLVAVHWRHPVADYPTGGDEVHAALAARSLHRLVRHIEADFVLDVLRAGDPRSVAAHGGLLAGRPRELRPGARV